MSIEEMCFCLTENLTKVHNIEIDLRFVFSKVSIKSNPNFSKAYELNNGFIPFMMVFSKLKLKNNDLVPAQLMHLL